MITVGLPGGEFLQPKAWLNQELNESIATTAGGELYYFIRDAANQWNKEKSH
ncbi:unnamed protein product [marine sediment metagenome]|uniref:Uncharacterized protein n=1 Tax=marine sediment metagenome TaxID=412755 RepID=X1HQ11_9ZZZZ